jgi:hypothetical protein
VVPLLAFGLCLIAVALVPGLRRLPALLVLASLLSALVARAVTGDAFLIAAAGLVPLLLGLLALEIADTLNLLSKPSRQIRRVRGLEKREIERERERRRRERERRRMAA